MHVDYARSIRIAAWMSSERSGVITHRAKLEAGPDMYKTFHDKEDQCIKVVLTP